MAFTKPSVVSGTGIVVQNAYVRVVSIMGDKEKLTVTFYYYASQQAREEGKSPFKIYDIQFQPSVEQGSDNFIKQAYDYAKEHDPEFADAIDLLDD